VTNDWGDCYCLEPESDCYCNEDGWVTVEDLLQRRDDAIESRARAPPSI
jgi:hypothetical protein